MPTIPPKEEEFICDACGKSGRAWYQVYGDAIKVNEKWQYLPNTPVLCRECQRRAIVWAAKQSLNKE